MMKKLRIWLLLCLVAALLMGCGGGGDATEPPTEPPTDPPTEEVTDPPTEAPTDPPEVIVGWYLKEPEGFFAASSGEGMSILAGPDGDGSSITVVTMELAIDMSVVTEEYMSGLLGAFGEEGETVLHSMEIMEVDGYPAARLDYTMTVSGLTALYRTYYVSVYDTTYVFGFADATADGAWKEAYDASAASINILVEGETVPVDTTGLELYDLGCGLSVYAEPGLTTETVEGFAACLGNEYVAMLVIEDNKELYDLGGLTLRTYATLLVDGQTITGFEQDVYGNLATSFVAEGGDGTEYFYYVTVKETEESFWLIQTACPSDMASLLYDSFAQWNATITATE